MKNIVSFETAKKLQAAGFPQPENFKEAGFYFFEQDDGSFDPYSFRLLDLDSEWEERAVFAPCATDILNELGRQWCLYVEHFMGKWCCYFDGLHSPGVTKIYHENPAEACAAAWLSIRAKGPAL